MKKAKSSRAKTSSTAQTSAISKEEISSQAALPEVAPAEPARLAQGSSAMLTQRPVSFDEIPEDALPPQRPDPILRLQLSAALHSKLRHQAQDEGISVEALALEMLAESVVLRAWEIVERKNAMRSQSAGQNGSHGPNQGHRGAYTGAPQVNGNTKHPRSSYGSHPSQGHHGNSGRHSGYQAGNGRHQNNAWMEDKAAFLEYVRNQEKRGRR